MPATVGFLLFQIGAPLFLVNFITIGLGATLINAAVGVGLSLVAGRLLAPDVQTPELKPSDVQTPIRQAVPPRIRSYGTVRLAGVVFWREADEANGILYLGQILNEGRIGSFVQLLIDNNVVSLGGDDQVDNDPYDDVTTEILTRLGVDPETEYTELDTVFGAGDVRGDGIASMLGIFENFIDGQTQQENYPNVIPQLKATINASVVWDWRDSDQDRDDESTWEFSDNPVVCALDYLTHAAGFAIPYSRFSPNLAQWTAEADKCDVLINGAKRFRLALTYDYSQPPGQVLDQILRSCDGKVWPRSDGTIGIKVGVFGGTEVTIGSADVLGYRVTRGQDRLTAVAGVRATYMNPAGDFLEAEAEPWPDAETVTALDEDRVERLDLAMVPSEDQARRLMQIFYKRATSPVRLTMTTTLAGERCIDERWCRVELPERNIAAAFEIEDLSIDFNTGRCTMELVQHVPFAELEEAGEVAPDVFQIVSWGKVVDESSTSDLDYDTVVSGNGPEVGDLVVWMIAAVGGTWGDPSGWTVIDNATGTFIRRVAMWKVVDAADLATPISPIGSASGMTAHWYAVRNFAGTPVAANFADNTPTNGDPAAVDLDFSAVAGPMLAFSWHSSVAGANLFTPAWIGADPDVEQSGDSNMTSFAALIEEGAFGPDLQVDMGDEGFDNCSGGFEIHFT